MLEVEDIKNCFSLLNLELDIDMDGHSSFPSAPHSTGKLSSPPDFDESQEGNSARELAHVSKTEASSCTVFWDRLLVAFDKVEDPSLIPTYLKNSFSMPHKTLFCLSLRERTQALTLQTQQKLAQVNHRRWWSGMSHKNLLNFSISSSQTKGRARLASWTP